MYTVQSVMSSPVLTIAANETVSAAMHQMKQKNISSLIVMLPDRQYGLITKRDVVGKIIAAGLNQDEVQVADVCTSPFVSIAPNTSLRECSARMMDLKVRRLPVCDAQGVPIGIITETDIFMAVEERGWGPDQLGESKLRAIGTLARIRRTTVAEMMSQPVAMIAAETLVSDALVRMSERGISSLIVMPRAGAQVYGIITKRDIISKVVARNRDPKLLRVADVMSAPIYTIEPHVTLPQCAVRMVELGVRRLTVTHEQQPVGIISDTDIFRAVEGKRVESFRRNVSTEARPIIHHISKAHGHTAADVMSREVLSIAANATVSQALEMMEAENVDNLLVEPSQVSGKFGIITQRDIVTKVVAREQDPDALTVGEIASTGLITVGPEASIGECSAIMTQRNIRRLPVKVGDQIIGLVSDTDIFAAVEAGAELVIETPVAVAPLNKAAEQPVPTKRAAKTTSKTTPKRKAEVTKPNAKATRMKKVVKPTPKKK
jgi:isocitrate dehydrogenase